MTITSHDNNSDAAGVSNDPGSQEPPLRSPRSTRYRVISRVLLAILLLGILVPIIIAISYGMSGYTTYNDIRNQAQSGVQHLLNVKTIFTGVKAHPSGFLDNSKLSRSRQEFGAAYTDFQQVEYKLDHSSLIHSITTYFPQYLPQVRSARAVSQVGMDISVIGQQLTASALSLAPTFRGPLLTDTTKPLVTQGMLNLVSATINGILPGLNDIQTQSHFISLDALAVSEQQRNQLQQLLQALPQIQTDLVQVRDLLGAANWLLGVNEPRTFLVQTMDRAELRPTGGFTGQYGELQIHEGRIAPFNLRDISLLEYVVNSKTMGQFAPLQYRSWWPFENWGLRDSNVSADFPTSAQIAIHQYEFEVGHHVDGVILFTPFLVEHILQIIGPIYVPAYKDTITAQNLEDRLHYYQQDNAGIYKQIVIQPGVTATSARKRFTDLLAHLLLDKIRHAPPDEILAIAQDLLHDLKTKDVEVYFTNPQVEALLAKYDYAAQINRSTTQDGLYVVQANLSASKASQYVKTIMHDTVTLDVKGGATHVLQLRLVYNQVGPVYGYDTYHDYVRIYVPTHSQYLWGDGFDTGLPLCGGSYQQCQPDGIYPQGELLCPTGQFQSGAAAPTLTNPDASSWHPLDTIGPPTNFESDEPGRAMIGGWVVVPKNCTMTVTVSWYVPPSGATPYSIQIQRQAGTFPELDLTILPTPGNCNVLNTTGLHFDGIMNDDMTFTTKGFTSLLPSSSTGCYPQPGI
ncbi:MAG TPA: DUF4012 domain-containing protein [Ktedonobacteraceae bacterium]|nr:DUF4012 domain-containing protein [Ktedonobacteraceae bacterium]